MKVSWTKLIWEVVIVGIIVALVWSHWPEPKAVSVVDKPFVCTSVQYEAGECYPITPPVVSTPAPILVPKVEKPVIIVRSTRKSAPNSRVKHLSCSIVPSIAYSFPLDQVLARAKERGLSASQLADLTTCWENRHG